MRMWMVPPAVMCRQHLLGEHNELHMLAGCLAKGKSIAGYIKKNIVMPQKIRSRHRALAAEMKARGYRHRSPLPEIKSRLRGRVDVDQSLRDLIERCPACEANFKQRSNLKLKKSAREKSKSGKTKRQKNGRPTEEGKIHN